MSKRDTQKRNEKEAELVDFLEDVASEIKRKETSYRNKKVSTAMVRDFIFMENLKSALDHAFKDKLPVPAKTKIKDSKTDRILNLIISDTHYGSDLDPKETGSKYGPVEEARRTAKIIEEVVNYKLDHRENTELYVHLLGDLIDGNLHDPRSGAPLAQQCARAANILTQAIRYLSANFKKVTVFTAVGNHDRIKSRHMDRAVNEKHDSLANIIYFAIKLACEQIKNVEVNIGYEPKYEFKLFDGMGFATHGDSVLNAGYPAKSINTQGLKKQINEINNARIVSRKKPFSVFMVGHVHIGSMTHLSGGATMITNGCLIPPDPFAISIGITHTTNGMWMFESVPGHVIGDSRFITVDEKTDKNTSLDAIIRPFKKF